MIWDPFCWHFWRVRCRRHSACWRCHVAGRVVSDEP